LPSADHQIFASYTVTVCLAREKVPIWRRIDSALRNKLKPEASFGGPMGFLSSAKIEDVKRHSPKVWDRGIFFPDPMMDAPAGFTVQRIKRR